MYKTVLLAIDPGADDSWTFALPQALNVCRASGARLHMVTVVPDFGMSIVGQYFPAGYEKQAAEKAMGTLHSFTAEHVPEDVKVRHVVGEGNVYEVILDTAKKIEADLIVIAAHRPGHTDFLLGSNAARVVRHAKCSVLVARG